MIIELVIAYKDGNKVVTCVYCPSIADFKQVVNTLFCLDWINRVSYRMV